MLLLEILPTLNPLVVNFFVEVDVGDLAYLSFPLPCPFLAGERRLLEGLFNTIVELLIPFVGCLNPSPHRV